jgi:hypothetical protein
MHLLLKLWNGFVVQHIVLVYLLSNFRLYHITERRQIRMMMFIIFFISERLISSYIEITNIWVCHSPNPSTTLITSVTAIISRV